MRATIVVQPWAQAHPVEIEEAQALMRKQLVLDGMEVECTGWFMEADEEQPWVKLHVRGVDEGDRAVFDTEEWKAKQAYGEGQHDMGYYVFMVTAFQMQLPDGAVYSWLDGAATA
jgi:hypothetical protein